MRIKKDNMCKKIKKTSAHTVENERGEENHS